MGESKAEDLWTGDCERRRTPRDDVAGGQAHLLTLDVPVTVVQVGLGGFRIRTTFVFLVGSRHAFRFRLGDGSTIDVEAQVIHCLPHVTKGGAPVYLTGLEFVDTAEAGARTAAEDLVDDGDSQLLPP